MWLLNILCKHPVSTAMLKYFLLYMNLHRITSNIYILGMLISNEDVTIKKYTVKMPPMHVFDLLFDLLRRQCC